MRIYLDNNATTPIHPAVLDSVVRAMRDGWGNASSVHREGQAARRALEEARERLAGLLGCEPREVVFTSGGSESNNAAIFGLVPPGRLSHIVTTSIEHPSALEPVRALERRGCAVTYVGCDARGVVAAEAVIAALRPDTALVVMMLAHNETGAIQPVAGVAAVCRERGISFHCDAVQAAGRIPLDAVRDAGTVAVSAHKMHGPKGIGALRVRKGVVLEPLVVGGAQERRRRAGTENVPLAVGFGAAAVLAAEADPGEVRALRDRFEELVTGRVPDVRVLAAEAPRIPNTANLLLGGSDAEAVVIGADLRGLAISTGSACSSGRVEPSRVLIEMGLSEEDARSSVRVSFGRLNTAGEVERAAGILAEVVEAGRRTAPRALSGGEGGD
ncbi:MAG: cysteine desulfurase family protein [Thermoanaerobaculia bacterium]